MKKKLSKTEEKAYQEIKGCLNELPKESLDKGSLRYSAEKTISYFPKRRIKKGNTIKIG